MHSSIFSNVSNGEMQLFHVYDRISKISLEIECYKHKSMCLIKMDAVSVK